MRAARVAFEESLALDDYHAARAAAGRGWDALRPDLLAALRAAPRAHHRTAILLEEGLVDEAVAGVRGRDGDHPGREVLLRLTEAAHASHPDWVIALAERWAGEIMDQGSAGHYAEAAEWLKRAALAYDPAGRIDDWSARIEALIATHRRKHKLRPLLEALRFGG